MPGPWRVAFDTAIKQRLRFKSAVALALNFMMSLRCVTVGNVNLDATRPINRPIIAIHPNPVSGCFVDAPGLTPAGTAGLQRERGRG